MVWVMSALGLIILLVAGDFLVRGAVNLSLRLGIPALIVSLTIVAFGTSAPELIIAIKAAMEGASGIALGNVVGSNTANVLLVLGLPAIVSALDTHDCETRKTYIAMLMASVLFIGLAFTGQFGLWQAAILLTGLAIFLLDALRDARKHRNAAHQDVELEGADPSISMLKILIFLGIGLTGLPFGADMLVDNATIIARQYGVSETVIGLTLVAVGTSLPELATTVMAATRKQADVALGNVIGSNLFNLLAIIGIASLFGPIDVAKNFLRFDLWVMLAASLILIPFVFMGLKLNRIWGIILTAVYISYVMVLIH
jgi:cation:H+ antiporter